MPQPRNRNELEANFASLMQRANARQRSLLVSAMGWPPKVERIPDRLIRQIEGEIAQATQNLYLAMYILSMENMADEFDYTFDENEAVELAIDFAQTRSRFLSQSIVNTTVMRLGSLANTVSELDRGPQKATWDDSLAELFSMDRPNSIAVTEVTNSTTAGEMGYKKKFQSKFDDLVLEAFWVHRWPIIEGRHPCTRICARLVDQPSILWPDLVPDYPDAWSGPEGHVNCDCALEWRILTPEERFEYGYDDELEHSKT